MAVLSFLYVKILVKIQGKMAVQNFSLSMFVFLFLSCISFATPLSKRGPDDDLAVKALENAYKVLNGTLSDGSAKSACTKETLVVRKE